MAYVTFTYKNGKQRRMPERDAKILQKLKKGGYQQELAAQATAPVDPQPQIPAAVEQVQPAPVEPVTDELDAMDREQLLKFAEDLEIKIHGRTGDEKIREIIREHTK